MRKKKPPTKNAKKNKDPEQKKTEAKFGVLGKDLSNKFNWRSPKSQKPARYGGRNGNGKPT